MSGEPVSTAAGGVAFYKLGVAILGISVVASVLGFVVLWPKTIKEGISRMFATILSSCLFGPALAIAAYTKFPAMFIAAGKLAERLGQHEVVGYMAAGAPWMVLAGMPAWWIGGAMALWFERRRGKDLAEMAADAAGAFRSVKP